MLASRGQSAVLFAALASSCRGGSGLAEDPVHSCAADRAGALGHPAAIRLGGLTVEVALFLAFHAVPVVAPRIGVPFHQGVCRAARRSPYPGRDRRVVLPIEYLDRGVTDYSPPNRVNRMPTASKKRCGSGSPSTRPLACSWPPAASPPTRPAAASSNDSPKTRHHPRTGRPRHHHRRHRHPEPGQTPTELNPNPLTQHLSADPEPDDRSSPPGPAYPLGCVASHPELAKTMSPDAHGDALAVLADQFGQSAVSLAHGLDQPVTRQRMIELAVRGIPGAKHASMRAQSTPNHQVRGAVVAPISTGQVSGWCATLSDDRRPNTSEHRVVRSG